MFLELNNGWESNRQVDSIPFFVYNLNFKSPNGECRTFSISSFQDLYKILRKPIGMLFTICIFCPKDSNHFEISILEMGKPFGTSGTHFPTLV
jgi:hypothetical protein